VDDVAVTARELSNLAGSNQTASLSFRWETNGAVRLDASARIAPLAAELNLSVHKLELRPLDPYLEPFVNIFLRSSEVNLDGRILMSEQTNGLPGGTFGGNLQLNNFATLDATAEDLVKWTSLRLDGIEASLPPPALTVKEIIVVDPGVRVAVETNHAFNLLAAMRLGQTNLHAEPAVPDPVAASAATKGGMGKRLGSILSGLLDAGSKAGGASALPKITVGAVVISNALVQFQDRSFEPQVVATLEQLNGAIVGLSSEELHRAELSLEGKIGRSGAIKISGKLNPLNQNSPTELEATIQGVDLSPASPYSGKFLGYRLNRGKLNLQVSYEVAQRQLKAKNLVVLDQFTLGDKVESPDATKLPVRLAVALLKDRSGEIRIDVPIEGNLDDPQFHFGKVITRVVVNLITKMVTSPFAALGALLGGEGEELSYLDFASGTSDLPADGVAKLGAPINALYERPGLELEIEGSFAPIEDRDALRRQGLNKLLCLLKWQTMRATEQSRIAPDRVTLAEEEHWQFLRAMYAAAARAGAVGATPSTGRPPPSTPSKLTRLEPGAPGLVAPHRPATAPDSLLDMEHQVLETIPVSEGDLRRLAADRGQRVYDHIVQSGRVEATRLFLLRGDAAVSTNLAARVHLRLR